MQTRLTALVLMLGVVGGLAATAAAHNTAGLYNFGYCSGSWWSDALSKNVEAGMNDSATSTGYNLCKASRVEARLRDDAGVFYTVASQDSLMPLFAEVDTYYWYIAHTNHMSKDENNVWWTIKTTHNHY